MSRATLIDFLTEHKSEKPISFHMPGHKGRSALYDRFGYGDFIRDMTAVDITEIPGADNLHYPTGPIKSLKERYAGMYGAEHTELLVNGGSAGVMAAIMASVPYGGRLLMGRNSHVSAYSALRLRNITPVYVMPREDGKVSAGDVTAALSDESSGISAVFVTSPDYYGVMSDIASIAGAAHARGLPLIVDQAHGAHLAFFDSHLGTTYSAERQGADLVINSTHKTLLSFTGTGILNICSDMVSHEDVSGYLSMLQTTSPSYIALGSLDANEMIMRRGSMEIVGNWISDIRYFHEKAAEIEGLAVLKGRDRDPSKLPVMIRTDLISRGYSRGQDGGPAVLEGGHLMQKLMEHGIWAEMSDRTGVLLMTGAGSVREDYDRLLDALKKIVCEKTIIDDSVPLKPELTVPDGLPEYAGVPEKCEYVPLYSAEGRVAGTAVTLYPPGVPLICPGEVFTYEMISYLGKLIASGDTVIGVDAEGLVSVGRTKNT